MSLKIVARIRCNVEPCDSVAEIEIELHRLAHWIRHDGGELLKSLPEGWKPYGGSTCVCPVHATTPSKRVRRTE